MKKFRERERERERGLEGRKANGHREEIELLVMNGRRFKGRRTVVGKAKGHRFKGMRRVAGKSNGRRFEGMRRVVVKLNRRRLALNEASLVTVGA